MKFFLGGQDTCLGVQEEDRTAFTEKWIIEKSKENIKKVLTPIWKCDKLMEL